MTFQKNYQTTLANGQILEVETQKGVFYPTYTSELLLKALVAEQDLGVTLDLGCGCGVVGLAAAASGRCLLPLQGSDVSAAAVDLARRNALRAGVKAEYRSGSLFEPWAGSKFDTILDDVAGIAEAVAAASSWYNHGVPCAAGVDGAELTLQMLRQAPAHLKPGGRLFFPVISLSNTERILLGAKPLFRKLECAVEQAWMLPDELCADSEWLADLKAKHLIDYEEKFGAYLCWTKIYRAEV